MEEDTMGITTQEVVVIVNRTSKFSTIDNTIVSSDTALKVVYDSIKKRVAKKVIDTEFTLMYKLSKSL